MIQMAVLYCTVLSLKCNKNCTILLRLKLGSRCFCGRSCNKKQLPTTTAAATAVSHVLHCSPLRVDKGTCC